MEHIRTISLALDVGERVELQLENRSGAVSVRGEDTRQVAIEVTARLWAESEADADAQAEEIVRGILRDGHRIIIRAPALVWPGPFFFGRGPRPDHPITPPPAPAAPPPGSSPGPRPWSGRGPSSSAGDPASTTG